jgi:hypothetical protein
MKEASDAENLPARPDLEQYEKQARDLMKTRERVRRRR